MVRDMKSFGDADKAESEQSIGTSTAAFSRQHVGRCLRTPFFLFAFFDGDPIPQTPTSAQCLFAGVASVPPAYKSRLFHNLNATLLMAEYSRYKEGLIDDDDDDQFRRNWYLTVPQLSIR